MESLNAKLGRELAGEVVELVRVAACDEDAAVGQEVGGGVVHPGNGRGCQHLEPGFGVVGGVVDGVESRVAGLHPPLRPVPGAVDDQHVARRQDHHFAHVAPDWHRLHAPLRVGGSRYNSAAGIRRWPPAWLQ